MEIFRVPISNWFQLSCDSSRTIWSVSFHMASFYFSRERQSRFTDTAKYTHIQWHSLTAFTGPQHLAQLVVSLQHSGLLFFFILFLFFFLYSFSHPDSCSLSWLAYLTRVTWFSVTCGSYACTYCLETELGFPSLSIPTKMVFSNANLFCESILQSYVILYDERKFVNRHLLKGQRWNWQSFISPVDFLHKSF